MKTICLLIFSFLVNKGFGQNVSGSALLKAGVISYAPTKQTFPIHIWNDFILIDAKINGVLGTFIWDNGLSFCALDSVFAEKAGVRFNTRKRDTVVDGNEKILRLEAQYANKIQIGAFSEEHTHVFDLNIDKGFFKN